MNPFHEMARCVEGPAWRWRCAERIARTPREHPSEGLALPTDGQIREAVASLQYCQASADGEDLAKAHYPRIAAAQALWDSPGKRSELKILIMADCPREEIAERYGVAADVVEACEELFYDVRAAREAIDWIAWGIALQTRRLQETNPTGAGGRTA